MSIAFVNELMGLVSGATHDKIMQHAQHHERYLELTSQKKTLLKDYKDHKIQHKKVALKKIDSTNKPYDRLQSQSAICGDENINLINSKHTSRKDKEYREAMKA